MDRLTQDFGFGIIPKQVMKDTNLSLASKGLYSYLCAYAGNKNTAFPSISLITHELGISKDTFYKYMKELKDAKYIDTYQEKEKGKFSHSVYKLLPCPKSSDTVLSDTETPDTENMDTKKNSLKKNSLKKNKTTTKPLGYNSVIETFTQNVELQNTILEFIKMRKAIKATMTDNALKLLLNKLNKMATTDELKVKILEQSIMNSWKGIFELKEVEKVEVKTQRIKTQPITRRADF